jgi:hypothetical protein
MNYTRHLRLAVTAAVVFTVIPLKEQAAANGSNLPAITAPLVPSDLNDVMGGKMPKLPTFPKLAKKPGYLRGYVRDTKNKPLVGASIMILPPTVFGSGFTKRSVIAKTDANGLYEIPVPSGGCTVWCTGYAVDYHGVRLALPLHPVDGELGSINKQAGDIENFVLLSYGIADPSTASSNPVYANAYYGAAFTVSYATYGATDPYSPPGWLLSGSEVELTLTPQGPLVDGTTGRPLIIRKKLESGSYFQVNDIPIGRYQIQAKVTENGKIIPLRLKENVRNPRMGGMTPTETTEAAVIIFRSSSGDPTTLRVPGGNMERLELLIEKAS